MATFLVRLSRERGGCFPIPIPITAPYSSSLCSPLPIVRIHSLSRPNGLHHIPSSSLPSPHKLELKHEMLTISFTPAVVSLSAVNAIVLSRSGGRSIVELYPLNKLYTDCTNVAPVYELCLKVYLVREGKLTLSHPQLFFSMRKDPPKQNVENLS